MKERYQTLSAIEYAFVVALIASFSVLAVAGFFYGFYVNEWSEREGILVAGIATIAGVAGAALGVRMSSPKEQKR
jgi:hypothetical protein